MDEPRSMMQFLLGRKGEIFGGEGGSESTLSLNCVAVFGSNWYVHTHSLSQSFVELRRPTCLGARSGKPRDAGRERLMHTGVPCAQPKGAARTFNIHGLVCVISGRVVGLCMGGVDVRGVIFGVCLDRSESVRVLRGSCQLIMLIFR